MRQAERRQLCCPGTCDPTVQTQLYRPNRTDPTGALGKTFMVANSIWSRNLIDLEGLFLNCCRIEPSAIEIARSNSDSDTPNGLWGIAGRYKHARPQEPDSTLSTQSRVWTMPITMTLKLAQPGTRSSCSFYVSRMIRAANSSIFIPTNEPPFVDA